MLQAALQLTSLVWQAWMHISAGVGGGPVDEGMAASEEEAASDDMGADMVDWALATAATPAKTRAVKRIVEVVLVWWLESDYNSDGGSECRGV